LAGCRIENRREFEVDDTKPAVETPVSDIAELAICVSHTVSFQFVEDFLLALRIKVIHAAAAVGRDDFQVLGFHFDELWHEVAVAVLKVSQHPHLRVRSVPSPDVHGNILCTRPSYPMRTLAGRYPSLHA